MCNKTHLLSPTAFGYNGESELNQARKHPIKQLTLEEAQKVCKNKQHSTVVQLQFITKSEFRPNLCINLNQGYQDIVWI